MSEPHKVTATFRFDDETTALLKEIAASLSKLAERVPSSTTFTSPNGFSIQLDGKGIAETVTRHGSTGGPDNFKNYPPIFRS